MRWVVAHGQEGPYAAWMAPLVSSTTNARLVLLINKMEPIVIAYLRAVTRELRGRSF